MVEYKLQDENCFSFGAHNDTIYFGLKEHGKLSDSELINFVSDCITHEYIHKVLYDLFDFTTSRLFDMMEQYFRIISLHEKAISDTTRMTYQQYINYFGIDRLFDRFGVSNSDIKEAQILCNNRNSGGE